MNGVTLTTTERSLTSPSIYCAFDLLGSARK